MTIQAPKVRYEVDGTSGGTRVRRFRGRASARLDHPDAHATVRAEYMEMPGPSLTVLQAARLFVNLGRKPFDLFAIGSETGDWLGGRTEFATG